MEESLSTKNAHNRHHGNAGSIILKKCSFEKDL